MSKDFNKRISKGKSIARLMAVQALYSNSIVDLESQAGWNLKNLDKDLLKIASEIAKEHSFNDEDIIKKIDKKFFKTIIEYVAENTEKLDTIIVTYLSNEWQMDKIGILLCSILRAALFELKEDKKTAPSIIISEYISITGEFFDKQEIGFVNATLDRMAKDIKNGIMTGAESKNNAEEILEDIPQPKRKRVEEDIIKASQTYNVKNIVKDTLKFTPKSSLETEDEESKNIEKDKIEDISEDIKKDEILP